jgi:thiol:disulfide interchange protein DsbC
MILKNTKIALSIAMLSSLPVFAGDSEESKRLFEDKFKATFNQNTFSNFEPAPISGMFQMEISNQIVYFDPKSELIIFGEIYDKNGISVSAKTKEKWQSKKIANVDFSDAITIGNGPIQIVEFTDTDCPFCQRFDNWIVAKNNDYKKKNGKDLFTRKVVMTPILSLHPNAEKESIHLFCSNPKEYEATLSNLINNKITYADMKSCSTGEEEMAKHKKMAGDFGVVATPTLILDGKLINGFNQEKLESALNNLIKKNLLTTNKE